jgi:hypothetical protein
MRLLFTVLNALPIWGPRIIRTAITTMAIKTRIKAYSTNPWPLAELVALWGLEANNMQHLLSTGFLYRRRHAEGP